MANVVFKRAFDSFFAGNFGEVRITASKPNPLAAMCSYRNTFDANFTAPAASTAKPAAPGLMFVREIGDRSRIGA